MSYSKCSQKKQPKGDTAKFHLNERFVVPVTFLVLLTGYATMMVVFPLITPYQW